jgi:VanZ family protein
MAVRQWCAAAALGSVVFATYVTLVPFQFKLPESGASLLGFLREQVELGSVSRGNGLANVLLFIPTGFFGLGALVGRTTTGARWVWASIAVALISLLVSIGIEALQAFVPGRTPALIDVVAQAVGTAAGMTLWPVLGSTLFIWLERLRGGRADAAFRALGVYTVVLGIYLVLPLDVTVDLGALAERYRTGRIVLNPSGSPSLAWEHLPAMIADFVMACPVGVLAALTFQRHVHRPLYAAVASVIVFFGAGEAVQVFILSRTADVVDGLVNVLGATTGAMLANRIVAALHDDARARQTFLTATLAVTAGLYVVYNWSPFDFTWPQATIAERFARLASIPFASYYENPEFKALSDVTVKLAMSMPLGLLVQLIVRPETRGLVVRLLVLTAAVLFFSAVEAGQVLLASRFPDISDVILAVAGLLMAMAAVRRFQQPNGAEKPIALVPVRERHSGSVERHSELVEVLRTPSGGQIIRRRRRRGRPGLQRYFGRTAD